MLNLSGWHDDNYGPEGAATNYEGLVAARRGDTSGAALLLGPWTHGVGARIVVDRAAGAAGGSATPPEA